MTGHSIRSFLETGNAFVDVSDWRKVAVEGPEGPDWLNDLISADIAALQAGQARRSLLLSPTGQVRAEFTVAMTANGLLLIQDPSQAKAIDDLLSPYVLSSDVELRNRTEALSLFAFPGGEAPRVRAEMLRPSCLGFGVDLLMDAEHHDEAMAALRQEDLAEANEHDLDGWRVEAGIPRLGVDATEGDLPQEAGFEDAVSFEKGCYLGQEAMARVRNFGHPRRVVLHLEADGSVAAGEGVAVDGVQAGRVTSAATRDARTRALARVEWDARQGPFRTSSGVELRLVPPTSAR